MGKESMQGAPYPGPKLKGLYELLEPPPFYLVGDEIIFRAPNPEGVRVAKGKELRCKE